MSETPSLAPVTKTWDVAIIGGGLAGGAAAYHLARRGLKVILFEKEKSAHHKVCGEFISGEGIPLLEEMGINLRSLGAVPISGFRLHGPHRTVRADLPLAACGLSRERLDEEVLRKAGEAGAEIRRGVLVKERLEGLESAARVITLSTSEGEVRARRLILASGKSEFKSIHRRSGRDSGLVGFKMHLRLKPSALKRLKGHCDLFVFEGGYGGLAMIENGLANFCFLINRNELRRVRPQSVGEWGPLAAHISKLNEGLSHYLDGAEPQFPHFVTVARVPYGFLRRETPEAGVYCVGDQMAVIPSLSGDGMTIALRTGAAAAAAIAAVASTTDRPPALRLGPASAEVIENGLRSSDTAFAYQRAMRAKLRTQIETAYLLHRLFKNPRLCDWATFAIKAFPPVLDFFFTSTRCQVPVLLTRSLGPAEGIKSLEA